MTILLSASAAMWNLSACGKAKIDTGDNSEAPLRPSPLTPSEQGECWASTKTLPPTFVDFCERTPTKLKKDFKTALDTICRQGKLVNLMRENCGWNGDGNGDGNGNGDADGDADVNASNNGTALDHLRVLHSTPLTDHQSSEFEYLSAYALNAGPAPFSYPATLMLAALDPKAFRSAFEVPGAATMTPDGTGIFRSDKTTRFRYNFESNGLAKFAFLGEVDIFRVDANLVAVFNQAVGNLEGVTIRRNLTLVSKLSNGREKMLTIEERLVPDMGHHQIALSKMLKLDRMEIENRYKNSQVRQGPPELDILIY